MDIPGEVYSVALSGNYAYVAVQGSGLRVIDITDPAHPQIVGNLETPGDDNGVAVSGNYAYIADGNPGIQVIDITNPANPQIVGTADVQAWSVSVNNGYAYAEDSVIDVTNPASPEVVANVPTYMLDVAFSGNYAYVAAGRSDGLQVVESQILVIPPKTGPSIPVIRSWYVQIQEVWNAQESVHGRADPDETKCLAIHSACSSKKNELCSRRQPSHFELQEIDASRQVAFRIPRPFHVNDWLPTRLWESGMEPKHL